MFKGMVLHPIGSFEDPLTGHMVNAIIVGEFAGSYHKSRQEAQERRRHQSYPF
jgi:hypothetical protein